MTEGPVQRYKSGNTGGVANPRPPSVPLSLRLYIYATHAEYGGSTRLVGNMDIAAVLSFGTSAALREDTREHIERLGGEGGYVVRSSHSIIDSVSPENCLAMAEAAREFGSHAGRGAGPCS